MFKLGQTADPNLFVELSDCIRAYMKKGRIAAPRCVSGQRHSAKYVDQYRDHDDDDRKAEALFELIESHKQENQTLAATRDLLLPKLMSGEIRLKDAKAVV